MVTVWHQVYNPFGNALLSTLVAAIPICTLLYFIALHPHRDKQGARHLGINAPYAAFYGVLGRSSSPAWGSGCRSGPPSRPLASGACPDSWRSSGSLSEPSFSTI